MPNGMYANVTDEFCKQRMAEYGLTEANKEEKKEQVRQHLTALLKACRTYNDFVELQKEVSAFMVYYVIELRGKRRAYEAYSFGMVNSHKVEYLLSDGFSVGKSEVSNLWKNYEFYIYN